MMDGSLILALVSTGAAIMNGLGLVLIWLKYQNLAYESLIFASEVLGALDGEEKDNPPPDLVIGALSMINRVSSLTRMV